jgi:hypothetical protein
VGAEKFLGARFCLKGHQNGADDRAANDGIAAVNNGQPEGFAAESIVRHDTKLNEKLTNTKSANDASTDGLESIAYQIAPKAKKAAAATRTYINSIRHLQS